jgi:hypothetical protein
VIAPHLAPAWTFGEGLDEAGLALLRLSSWTIDREKLSASVICPVGTTFDAAEALRLALIARVPVVVVVDVQIAPAPLGALSAEHEAGVRLFGELRAERLAGCSCTSPDPYECSVCSPEHEQYCNGYACAGCNPPLRCACHATSKSPPADDDPVFARGFAAALKFAAGEKTGRLPKIVTAAIKASDNRGGKKS